METRSEWEVNRRIRAFFDGHAPNWDDMGASECAGRLRTMMAALDIRPGDRVLDVGTGTGILFELLAPRFGPTGRMVAIDLSAEMLRRANGKRGGGTCACVQADAMALPFHGPRFDWVICYSVFPHFSGQHEALRELSGVLRPGGRLAVCHSQSREAINELHRAVGDAVGGHCLPEDPDMQAMIRQAGLTPALFQSLDDRYLVVAAKPPE